MKVQHPGIARAVESDLANASLLESFVGVLGGKRFDARRDARGHPHPVPRGARLRSARPRTCAPSPGCTPGTRRYVVPALVDARSSRAGAHHRARARHDVRGGVRGTRGRSRRVGRARCGASSSRGRSSAGCSTRTRTRATTSSTTAGASRSSTTAASSRIGEPPRPRPARPPRGPRARRGRVRPCGRGRWSARSPGRSRTSPCATRAVLRAPLRVAVPHHEALRGEPGRRDARHGAHRAQGARLEQFFTMPPEMLFVNRLQFGFYSVLARLDVEVDYAARGAGVHRLRGRLSATTPAPSVGGGGLSGGSARTNRSIRGSASRTARSARSSSKPAPYARTRT